MISSIVDLIMNSWWTPIICLALYSITWLRGDAQRNIAKYKRWDKMRLYQKRALSRKRVIGKR